MYKKFAVLYCILLCTKEIFGLKDLLETALGGDPNITKVRTVEELRSTKSEIVLLDFIGLVQQYKGYTAEEYDVQTDDGYILKMHRITGSPNSPAAPDKPVVFVMHGLILSSDSFVMFGPTHDLAFLLADAGYDVWFGNARGNTYSKRHVKFSSERNNYHFWNFSMDEIGIIDLPKMIDTTLEKTKQKKLTYIGFSMGTTTMYMLLSEKPEYNSKMKLVVSLAPVVYFNSQFFRFQNLLVLFQSMFKRGLKRLGYYELLPQAKYADFCSSKTGRLVCYLWMTNYLDSAAVPTIARYFPAGSSIYEVAQYNQMSVSGEFQKYDFGRLNEIKYGSFAPPKYNLSKMTAPQAIYYGDVDVYVSRKDTRKIRDTFNNIVIFQKTPPGYNHLDFIWAKNIRTEFLDKILDPIKKFT